MSRYQIAMALTMLTAIAGVLLAFDIVPVWVVAICGVVAGFWWAFGRGFGPNADREREERARKRAAR